MAQPVARVAPVSVRMRTFSSLRHRDFRLLWTSTFFTSGGQWLQQVTLGWLVYDLTGSALMLGLINGVRSIPFIFVSPLSGVAADRIDRRRLMMISQAYLMVLTLAMGLLVISDLVQVWHLFVFTLLSGTGWSFTMPVRQSLVPNLVPKEDLTNAIALNSAAFNSTRVFGPATAGLLIGWVGAGGNFLLQSLAYLGVVAMVLQMRVPKLPPKDGPASVWRDISEGLAYVRGNRTILTLLIVGLVPMFLVLPYASLLPIYSKDILNIGPEGLGLLYSLAGVGALIATMSLATAGDFPRKGTVQLLSLAMTGITLILFSQSQWLPLSLVFLAGVGGWMMGYMALNNNLLQISITDEVRGRVMSIYNLDQGMVPLGTFMAGALADVFGAPLTLSLMGGCASVLAVAAALRFPFLRQLG